jgi:(p)ppGpp synthase/HD superfamily hydrolase
VTEGASERLLAALDFAVRVHGKVRQARKGTPFPYVIHPMRVAEILSRYGCGEDLVVAGLLHDTVEDAGCTREQIEAEFGAEVARLVDGASEPDRSATWEVRKQHTLDYLRDEAPLDVALVAAADKLDNIRSIRTDLEHRGEELWTIFSRPREQQRWYYRGLAGAFLARDPEHPLFRAVALEVDTVFPP